MEFQANIMYSEVSMRTGYFIQNTPYRDKLPAILIHE